MLRKVKGKNLENKNRIRVTNEMIRIPIKNKTKFRCKLFYQVFSNQAFHLLI